MIAILNDEIRQLKAKTIVDAETELCIQVYAGKWPKAPNRIYLFELWKAVDYTVSCDGWERLDDIMVCCDH